MTDTRISFQSLAKSSIVALCIAFSGCASTGPAFQKVESIPPGKGLVYIYRPSTFHGAALVPMIVVKDFHALPLKSGGYYTYVAPPGPISIAINHTGRRTVDFDVKPGETYYVRGGMVVMGFGVPYIELATADKALPELVECKMMPDAVTP
jgi:hypothetical protein